MDRPHESESIARGRIEALENGHIVLAPPGTDYRIRLQLTVPASEVSIPVGKRIKGNVEAKALRIHPARGGGRFIEPIDGEPRIVAGTVLEVDRARQRVLVDVVIPMWMSWPLDQDPDVCVPGQLVNCYVESGATFTPRA